MSTGLIQVRIDDSVKREAESLFNGLGLDISTAVRIFLTQAIKRRGMPFAVAEPDDFFNAHNQQLLAASIDRLARGLGTEHELIEE